MNISIPLRTLEQLVDVAQEAYYLLHRVKYCSKSCHDECEETAEYLYHSLAIVKRDTGVDPNSVSSGTGSLFDKHADGN